MKLADEPESDGLNATILPLLCELVHHSELGSANLTPISKFIRSLFERDGRLFQSVLE
jgi:hypothetical protein